MKIEKTSASKLAHVNFENLTFGSVFTDHMFVCKYKDNKWQIVNRKEQIDDLYEYNEILLEEWYEKTGCPMLLNTSLNIRGEPMVNTKRDAKRFEKQYNVKVCS